MNSTIARRDFLHKLFNANNVIEVYTDEHFQLEDNKCELYIYYKNTIQTPYFLEECNKAFGECKTYFSNRPNAYLFRNKKLIWYKGEWRI